MGKFTRGDFQRDSDLRNEESLFTEQAKLVDLRNRDSAIVCKKFAI